MLKKWIIWAGIALVVFFVAFRPSAVGAVIGGLVSITVNIFRGVGDFFSSLVG